MNRLRLHAILMASLLAAGCSSGPSESDITDAINKQNSASQAAASKVMGKSADAMKTQVLSVKKIGCKEDGAAYLCDIEMHVKAPIVGEQKSTTKARFVKGSNGWTISQ